jgi:hypothetical protein
MRNQSWLLVSLVGVFSPVAAWAESGAADFSLKARQDGGFFAGVDVLTGKAYGSSDTKDGGAPFAGGGVVDEVKFKRTTGLGGHVGYRFDSAWSVFVSYQHSRGDVSWNADFPMLGVASSYKGKATSHIVMGNVAYDLALSKATALRLSGGVGVAYNKLADVEEHNRPGGEYLSELAEETKRNWAAQVGVGLRHRVTTNTELGLDLLATYTGGFETGDSRFGNLGETEIKPYRIDDVWRADLNASVRYTF